MKQVILFFLVVTLFACNNGSDGETHRSTDTFGVDKVSTDPGSNYDKSAIQNAQDSSQRICGSEDFLKLKNKQLQADFFRQLDSVRKGQYPNNDQDIYNLVDITPALLNKFLSDINIDSLRKNEMYEASYFFNIAPKEYTDSRKCDDVITVRFFSEDCSFRMIIDNVYPVKDVGCAGGAQVLYGFKIFKSRIIEFGRQAAG
jgi:hypothetical protein